MRSERLIGFMACAAGLAACAQILGLNDSLPSGLVQDASTESSTLPSDAGVQADALTLRKCQPEADLSGLILGASAWRWNLDGEGTEAGRYGGNGVDAAACNGFLRSTGGTDGTWPLLPIGRLDSKTYTITFWLRHHALSPGDSFTVFQRTDGGSMWNVTLGQEADAGRLSGYIIGTSFYASELLPNDVWSFHSLEFSTVDGGCRFQLPPFDRTLIQAPCTGDIQAFAIKLARPKASHVDLDEYYAWNRALTLDEVNSVKAATKPLGAL
jgi:hypothetical protein